MATEEFKSFDEIVAPDPRSAAWIIVDAATGARRAYALHDVHDALAKLTLSPQVPDHIQHCFLTARHLALYGWFVYRFAMVAQLQAYTALEFALRERLGHTEDERPPGLKKLFAKAVAAQLVHEDQIRDWPGHRIDLDRDGFPYQPGSWLRDLPERLAYFRNDLAHGTFTLNPDGGRTLRVVADVINQLYPASEIAAAT